MTPRPPAGGFVEPGLIDVTRWHPDPEAADVPVLHNLVGVARRP